MRIHISKYDLEKMNLPVNDPNFSEILVNYIQDNYFNGADSAVIYIAYNYFDELFELDLIPS